MAGGTVVPTFLCVDVEPDRFQIGEERTSSFVGFGLVADYLMEIRTKLEAATSRPVNYLWCVRMDPQIADLYGSAQWLFDSEHERFSALMAAGDEIGLHVHCWKFNAAAGRYTEPVDDPAWVEHTLELSLDAYRQALGTGCSSHRYGAGFFSNEIVDILTKRGVRFDLTCEPGTRQPTAHSGFDPSVVGRSDHRFVPQRTYSPSSAAFDVEDPMGAGGLTLIPLTSVNTSPVVRRPDRWLRGHRGPAHRTHRLWRTDLDVDRFWSLPERLIVRGEVAHLAWAIRSTALIAQAEAPLVRSRLDALASQPLASRLHFTTPSAWGGQRLSGG